jgi:hypothetical protein
MLKSDAIDLPLALDAILQGAVFVSPRLRVLSAPDSGSDMSG